MLRSMLHFKWYLLVRSDQRIYKLMMHRAQMQSVLVAGTMPLNMELFAMVIKNMYTFAMFLLNVSS